MCLKNRAFGQLSADHSKTPAEWSFILLMNAMVFSKGLNWLVGKPSTLAAIVKDPRLHFDYGLVELHTH